MAKARLIYTDIPGALPAEFVLPPDLDLEISSVYARINGAAAAGSFRPCLTVLSQAGNLIARVPLDETYAVGDTGDATWSPFLRTQQAGQAGLPALPWARIARPYSAGNQTIGTASMTEVDVTQSFNVGAGESGADWLAADLTANELELVQGAVVSVHVQVDWFSALTNVWFPWVSQNQTAFTTYSPHAGLSTTVVHGSLEFVCRAPAGTAFSPGVFQTDGANRDLDAGMLEIVVLGTYTGTEFSAMNFNAP